MRTFLEIKQPKIATFYYAKRTIPGLKIALRITTLQQKAHGFNRGWMSVATDKLTAIQIVVFWDGHQEAEKRENIAFSLIGLIFQQKSGIMNEKETEENI